MEGEYGRFSVLLTYAPEMLDTGRAGGSDEQSGWRDRPTNEAQPGARVRVAMPRVAMLGRSRTTRYLFLCCSYGTYYALGCGATECGRDVGRCGCGEERAVSSDTNGWWGADGAT